ncbi:hypothetical protein AAXE64_06785 [Priestia megaterium]
MKLTELVTIGEQLESNLNAEHRDDILKWVKFSQLYVEDNYKTLTFTKQFCSTSEAMIQSIHSYEVYSDSFFSELLSSMKACQEYEEFKNKKLEDTFNKMK